MKSIESSTNFDLSRLTGVDKEDNSPPPPFSQPNRTSGQRGVESRELPPGRPLAAVERDQSVITPPLSRSDSASDPLCAFTGLIPLRSAPSAFTAYQVVTFSIAAVSAQFFFSQMGLWTLLEGLVLLANGFAILNEDRFLAPRGWSFSEVSAGGRTKSLKGQLIGLIYATQYLRVPLIIFNIIIIFVKMVSGVRSRAANGPGWSDRSVSLAQFWAGPQDSFQSMGF
ncbi:hypothetical protein Taro_009295 [Colocasia esculenta]|uniref:Uncharacterized protein n=1 Tax=Colocasia esculenta TaxID=4460 RepID=A0A843TZP4_COLES|nr:hypothetical protein [Colocasia esculenta]